MVKSCLESQTFELELLSSISTVKHLGRPGEELDP